MNFESMVDFVLANEGGYVNDPNDPGGETKFGISKRQYPALDIASLSASDAIRIYRRDYWDACRCGEMPPAIAALVFDGAANQGPGAAVKCLQAAINALRPAVPLAVDGGIGPKTLGALAAFGGVALRDLVDLVAAERAFLYAMADAKRYGHGWFRRLMQCHRLALGSL